MCGDGRRTFVAFPRQRFRLGHRPREAHLLEIALHELIPKIPHHRYCSWMHGGVCLLINQRSDDERVLAVRDNVNKGVGSHVWVSDLKRYPVSPETHTPWRFV